MNGWMVHKVVVAPGDGEGVVVGPAGDQHWEVKRPGHRRHGVRVSVAVNPRDGGAGLDRGRGQRFRQVLDASAGGDQEPGHPGLPDRGMRRPEGLTRSDRDHLAAGDESTRHARNESLPVATPQISQGAAAVLTTEQSCSNDHKTTPGRLRRVFEAWTPDADCGTQCAQA